MSVAAGIDLSKEAIVGSILGTAVGDAIRLPYEGLSARRARRLLGEPTRHRLLPGRGLVSDDTEHCCMVAQSLIAAGNDPDAFARRLASYLRTWLLSVPAGVGLATLKATAKLCLGFSPSRSGVFSAGNGPAMRSTILGAAVVDRQQMARLVGVSSRITHTDPKAERGALAVALAARLSSEGVSDGQVYLDELTRLLPPDSQDELLGLLGRVVDSWQRGDSTKAFAESMGLSNGVSGYMYHTVPVVVHAWLRHPRDFRSAIIELVSLGGDTDSTAAIAGGIIGCAVGRDGVPDDWLRGLVEWPRTVAWMERLGESLYESRVAERPGRPLGLPILGSLARNLVFLAIVLGHGFRRLAPPY